MKRGTVLQIGPPKPIQSKPIQPKPVQSNPAPDDPAPDHDDPEKLEFKKEDFDAFDNAVDNKIEVEYSETTKGFAKMN